MGKSLADTVRALVQTRGAASTGTCPSRPRARPRAAHATSRSGQWSPPSCTRCSWTQLTPRPRPAEMAWLDHVVIMRHRGLGHDHERHDHRHRVHCRDRRLTMYPIWCLIGSCRFKCTNLQLHTLVQQWLLVDQCRLDYSPNYFCNTSSCGIVAWARATCAPLCISKYYRAPPVSATTTCA